MDVAAADEADPTLASRVWCDSSEDSLINPVGRWSGVEQIMGFYRHGMGEMNSARDLEVSEVSVQVYSDAAWAEFNDRWCLVHVHYSALPAEKKAGTE